MVIRRYTWDQPRYCATSNTNSPRGQASKAEVVLHEVRVDVENQKISHQAAESWIYQGSQSN
jgi:hypothetical protein